MPHAFTGTALRLALIKHWQLRHRPDSRRWLRIIINRLRQWQAIYERKS